MSQSEVLLKVPYLRVINVLYISMIKWLQVYFKILDQNPLKSDSPVIELRFRFQKF